MRRERKWYAVTIRKATYDTVWVQSTTPEGAKANAVKEVRGGWEFDEVKAIAVKRWRGMEAAK